MELSMHGLHQNTIHKVGVGNIFWHIWWNFNSGSWNMFLLDVYHIFSFIAWRSYGFFFPLDTNIWTNWTFKVIWILEMNNMISQRLYGICIWWILHFKVFIGQQSQWKVRITLQIREVGFLVIFLGQTF